MSGALSMAGLGAGSLGSQLGLVGSLGAGLIGSALATASWRGVTFFMPNSQDQAGRRIVQIWFPGRDDFRTQDFGAFDGPIRVQGIIVGDDYVIRAKRMRAALMTAGTGTLVHPWWGVLQCKLLQPGTVSFSDRSLRVATFEAIFVRAPQVTADKGLFSSITDTLTNVLTQADALVDQAVLTVRNVLSPLTLPLALVSAVSSTINQAHGVWDGLTGSTAQLNVQSAAATPLNALSTGVTVPVSNTDTTFADQVSDLLVGVPAALVAAASPDATAAIAPAEEVSGTQNDALDPRTTASLLLSGSDQLQSAGQSAAAQGASPAAVLSLSLASQVFTVTQAVAVASGIDYTSQEDALSWRNTLLAALDTLADNIETLDATTGASIPTSGLLAALQDAKAAITADISERLGRLPAVLNVPVSRQMSAWLVAYAIAGENPDEVEDVWADLIVRNQLSHPALCGPGTVQVLQPTDVA
ncbi:hypothetical protein AZ09_04180 [Acetobacter aceti 1023]|nr:hypothetical protein AZ09_04180 [Acetobacter aceti 1023]